MLLGRGFVADDLSIEAATATLRRLSPRQQHAFNSAMRFLAGFVDATSAGLVKV